MNESETISPEQDFTERSSPVRNTRQPATPGNQIANPDVLRRNCETLHVGIGDVVEFVEFVEE